MKTHTVSIALVLLLALALTLGACSQDAPEPDVESTPPGDNPAAGLRLAPGYYELEGGVVQALGILEYVDLEGGYWVITGGFESEGTLGETVAVIANAEDFASELDALAGKTVLVTGTAFDGVSIRMAGPEIMVETIEEMSDTPGIAE